MPCYCTPHHCFHLLSVYYSIALRNTIMNDSFTCIHACVHATASQVSQAGENGHGVMHHHLVCMVTVHACCQYQSLNHCYTLLCWNKCTCKDIHYNLRLAIGTRRYTYNRNNFRYLGIIPE